MTPNPRGPGQRRSKTWPNPAHLEAYRCRTLPSMSASFCMVKLFLCAQYKPRRPIIRPPKPTPTPMPVDASFKRLVGTLEAVGDELV